MLNIFELLLLLVCVILFGKIECYTSLETDIIDNYVNGYYKNVYIDNELLTRLESGDNEESFQIKKMLVHYHRIDIIKQLGGSERIIELLKLLANNKNEEEDEEERYESSYGYSYELKDNLDRIMLTSRLDNNYNHYLKKKNENNTDYEKLSVVNVKLAFKVNLRNIFEMKSQRQYEFEVVINKPPIDEKNHLSDKKMSIDNRMLEFTSGFYISKGGDNSLNIESPIEMVSFKELVLIDKMKMFINGTNRRHLDQNLVKVYPICEIKCVIKELQNKIQWTEIINRFEGDNIKYIKSYNWCNKLIFHNCVNIGIHSLEISIMNDEMKKKVDLIKDSIRDKIDHQIENYFMSNIQTLKTPFDSSIIGESVVLNDLLEENGYVIKRNINNSLVIKHEKISKYSGNIVSLEEILNNSTIKVNLNEKEIESNTNNVNETIKYKILYSNMYNDGDYNMVSRIIPVKKSKMIYDIEQVFTFIRNILLMLKIRNKTHDYYLPWYRNGYGVRNARKKQNEFIDNLSEEYNLLLRIFSKSKYISKDMLHRMNLFNTYSLISHFKSYNISNYDNDRHNRKSYYSIDENEYIVLNTKLGHEDQLLVNNIYSQGYLSYNLNSNKGDENNNKLEKIEYLKQVKEYYIHNSEDDFSTGHSDNDSYFDDSFLDLNYFENNLINKTLEVSRPIKIVNEIKGNIDFCSENIVFQNNAGNYGFNIAFLNYMYQFTLNLDDSVINSTPWWIEWQSQFYPPISIESVGKMEEDLDLKEKYMDEYENNENDQDYFLKLSKKTFNSKWIEIPINSDLPISFFDLSSHLPRDIISKEMLESIIMEEVEFINPTFKGLDSLLDGKDRKFDLIQLAKEKQQVLVNSWKRSDLINDPNNMLFYNHNKVNSKKELDFNPCLFNSFFDKNSVEWFSSCVKKWEMYTVLFDHFILKANRYFKISTFFEVIKEIKMVLTIQTAIKIK